MAICRRACRKRWPAACSPQSSVLRNANACAAAFCSRPTSRRPKAPARCARAKEVDPDLPVRGGPRAAPRRQFRHAHEPHAHAPGRRDSSASPPAHRGVHRAGRRVPDRHAQARGRRRARRRSRFVARGRHDAHRCARSVTRRVSASVSGCVTYGAGSFTFPQRTCQTRKPFRSGQRLTVHTDCAVDFVSRAS